MEWLKVLFTKYWERDWILIKLLYRNSLFCFWVFTRCKCAITISCRNSQAYLNEYLNTIVLVLCSTTSNTKVSRFSFEYTDGSISPAGWCSSGISYVIQHISTLAWIIESKIHTQVDAALAHAVAWKLKWPKRRIMPHKLFGAHEIYPPKSW